MGCHQRLITEELYQRAIEQLASMNRDNRVAIRLMAIIAAKENGVGVVCKVFNITTNTLRNWVKSFAQGNDKSLEYKQGRGRKSKLTKNCCEAINKWLQDDCNMTIKNIIIKLKENLEIDASKSVVHRVLQKLKFAYITPRPVHYKQNKETHEGFKKKLQETITNNPSSYLYFFDESRFGTHSKLGYGWFRKGSRTQVKAKMGFQNFYVYSAVNPITGDDFTLMMPNVNTVCLNIFLAEMSKQIGEQKAIIVMDCAGWHKAKELIIATNIEILYLPPYSPELNPTEKLWQYLKSNTIKNRVYDTIEQLEIVVCSCLKI